VADAISVLKEDHRRVEQLFEQFADKPGADLARQICDELAIHAAVEAELVYPLLRTKVDRCLADEARREHGETWDLMAEIEDMLDNSQALPAAVDQLRDMVARHVGEEEGTVFPRIQERVGDILGRTGDEIAERRKELTAKVEADRAIGIPATSSVPWPASL
jgi:hemerythrin superfamily protein